MIQYVVDDDDNNNDNDSNRRRRSGSATGTRIGAEDYAPEITKV